MSKYEISLSDVPFPDTSTIERQVLADCVGNPESMPEFTGIVEDEMFTDDGRKYIWKTLVWMFNNGQVIDLATVSARTGRFYYDEVLKHGIYESTPLTALQHVMTLRSSAMRRRLYYSCVNLIQKTTRSDMDVLDMYSETQKLVMEVQGEKPVVAEVTMDEVLKAVDEEVKENRENTASGIRTRIPTGFAMLDKMTYGGFRRGQLIILAARPSVGKTAVMLQMAKAAARSGFPTTIFSLEMTSAELGQRLLFSTGKVTPQELTTGYVNEYGYGPAKEEIKSLPIFINDETRTLTGLLSRITVAVMQSRCGIAFIDYLGLVNIEEMRRSPLNEQIAKATRELKQLAKRLKIPIVLLCQLNREAAKEDGAPQLYHLRDSGSIEQDADIVLMLEQEKRVSEDIREKPNINIWVRKNRQFVKDIKLTVKPNETYSAFQELDANGMPAHQEQELKQQEDDEPF